MESENAGAVDHRMRGCFVCSMHRWMDGGVAERLWELFYSKEVEKVNFQLVRLGKCEPGCVL